MLKLSPSKMNVLFQHSSQNFQARYMFAWHNLFICINKIIKRILEQFGKRNTLHLWTKWKKKPKKKKSWLKFKKLNSHVVHAQPKSTSSSSPNSCHEFHAYYIYIYIYVPVQCTRCLIYIHLKFHVLSRS